MGTAVKLVAFAGSLRTDSFNKKLVRIAAEGARQAGADVTYVDLRDLNLPIFDADYEKSSGPPPAAVRFKNLLAESDGMLISSPEYNSSISAALKNAIDWASRPAEGEPPLVAFKGKVAALMAASPGALGGLRGLVHLRAILGNIGVIVLPEQVAVSKAQEAFDSEGTLRDARQQESILGLGRSLADVAVRLKRA
jgi:NAD(P)H-dependent FMN reductase